MNLASYRAEIQSLDPLTTNGVFFTKTWWKKEVIAMQYYNQLSSYQDTIITRQVIINCFKNYFGSEDSEAMFPFLLTMIWGYNVPNYGPYRVNNFARNEINKNIVRGALQEVKNNKLEKAFNLLMEIKHLSISFVSKVLYFAARSCDYNDYPLIFDIRVATSLVALASDGVLHGMVNVQPSKEYRFYDAYNKLIHRWALELEVEAEKIEYFIFKFQK